MEIFLTSSVHAVAHDIAKKVDLSKGNNLVFITTPVELKEGNIEWLKRDRQTLVDAGFSVEDYTITDKTRDQLKTDLNEFQYIYLSGGDTTYLLQQSQKSGFVSLIKELVKEGKVYIGTSAGSIIAGPSLPDYYLDERIRLENKEGYNLVNFTIMPHWGSEHFKSRYLGEELRVSRLKVVYNDNQVPFLLLSDDQYVHVQNEKIEIIDLKSQT